MEIILGISVTILVVTLYNNLDKIISNQETIIGLLAEHNENSEDIEQSLEKAVDKLESIDSSTDVLVRDNTKPVVEPDLYP